MPTMTDLIGEVNNTYLQLRQKVDDIEKEQKRTYDDLVSRTGNLPAEYKQGINDMNARMNELTDVVNKVLIEAKRPQIVQGSDDPWTKKQREVWLKAMKRKADLSLMTQEELAYIVPDRMPPEKKALYAGDATTGGFFASTDFVNELQAYRLLISKMRGVCRIQKTSGERVQMPALANDAEVYWATEQANYQESPDATFGMINIPVHEMRGLMRISEQNLEDSLFDLESFIKDRLTQRFAKKEGAAFLNGSGNGMARGILTYPQKATTGYTGGSAGKNNVTDAVPYVLSGAAAGKINADDILNVEMDLKTDYDDNATYCFTRGTLNTIRLFKDSLNRPLWIPFGSGVPATIYNRPYIEMPDMPEIAAGATPILVGDFQYYMIADRITLNFRQLNELYAVSGLVGYVARLRVGGDCLLPEAFRVLKCN